MTDTLGVGIVGCGLIGQKRARALGPARLVGCADLVFPRAEALARTAPGAHATDDWRALIDRRDVDVVIVATTNDALAEVASAALAAGKHVLVEKPGGRKSRELRHVIAAAKDAARPGWGGFNQRHHPTFRRA